jgi:hypothetical protein
MSPTATRTDVNVIAAAQGVRAVVVVGTNG